MKIGVDLGGSHIAIGIVNTNGEILEKEYKRFLNKEKLNIKEVIIEFLGKKVKEYNTKYKITKIGIAVPGIVKNNVIVQMYNLGIKNYNIIYELKKEIKIPIQIRNDAESAAIAEFKYGCMKDFNKALFLTFGTGIGSAMVIKNNENDKINVIGYEFGHTVIEKNGRTCNCGKKGCWEKYASMKAFKEELRKELGYDEKVSGEELINIIKNTNSNNEHFQIIDNIINKYLEYLTIGMSNVINICQPEIIGIGGSFVYFEDILLERLKTKLFNSNLLINNNKNFKIVRALFENDAGIIGAVEDI